MMNMNNFQMSMKYKMEYLMMNQKKKKYWKNLLIVTKLKFNVKMIIFKKMMRNKRKMMSVIKPN